MQSFSYTQHTYRMQLTLADVMHALERNNIKLYGIGDSMCSIENRAYHVTELLTARMDFCDPEHSKIQNEESSLEKYRVTNLCENYMSTSKVEDDFSSSSNEESSFIESSDEDEEIVSKTPSQRESKADQKIQILSELELAQDILTAELLNSAPGEDDSEEEFVLGQSDLEDENIPKPSGKWHKVSSHEESYYKLLTSVPAISYSKHFLEKKKFIQLLLAISKNFQATEAAVSVFQYAFDQFIFEALTQKSLAWKIANDALHYHLQQEQKKCQKLQAQVKELSTKRKENEQAASSSSLSLTKKPRNKENVCETVKENIPENAKKNARKMRSSILKG